jgi:hypothetical protein
MLPGRHLCEPLTAGVGMDGVTLKKALVASFELGKHLSGIGRNCRGMGHRLGRINELF